MHHRDLQSYPVRNRNNRADDKKNVQCGTKLSEQRMVWKEPLKMIQENPTSETFQVKTYPYKYSYEAWIDIRGTNDNFEDFL
jgi:hypothetical protein